jgi:hypothetical protein
MPNGTPLTIAISPIGYARKRSILPVTGPLASLPIFAQTPHALTAQEKAADRRLLFDGETGGVAQHSWP